MDASKWFSYPAELDKMVQEVKAHAGNDVYVTPALYSEDKRAPEFTTTANTVWCDADTADPSVFRLQPSYIVRSSENKWQTWWILDKPVKATDASRMARRIAHAHKHEGADISSWPANKIMRVPETTNTNYDWPFEVQGHNTGLIYSLADIEDAYPLEEEVENAPTTIAVSNPMPETFPDFMDVQGRLPADFNIDLITSEPADGLRSEMRWKLIAELVEAGLTDEETAAIAWEAKCSSKWHEDPRGIDGLWMEISKERARFTELTNNPPVPEEPAPARDRTPRPHPIRILSEEDRRRAKRHYQKTWLQEYEDWARANLKIYNTQYNMAGGLMALSNVCGHVTRLMIDGRDVPLNLYHIVLGETTTGKSQAKTLMRKVVHEAAGSDGNPDIGSNTSSGGLLKVIRERPNESILLTSDEADGFLNSMKNKTGWQADLMAKITDLYDGVVEPIQRAGETSDKWTKTSFSMFLMGTEVKVAETLDKTMFESGFLARVQWFIGEKIHVDKSLKGVRFSGKQSLAGSRETVNEWAVKFARISSAWGMASMNKPDYTIDIESPETEAWFQSVTADIEDGVIFGDHPERKLLSAAAHRTNISASKIAALLAIADERFEITKDDFLVALWLIESSLGNLVYIFNKVSASEHSKTLDLLETIIAGYPNGGPTTEIYRAMATRGYTKRDSDTYAEELKAQSRIKITPSPSGFGQIWRVNE